MALWGFVRRVHFQGLLRRCAPRAAASGGANRHPRLAVRSPLLYRSDVVLPLKAQPKKKETQKHSFRDYFAPSGLVPLLRNGANRGRGHKIHSLRSVCTFRDYFVAALLVPPSAGRTDSTGTKIHSMRSVCTFRDYFVAALLVPLLRNGANRHPRITLRSPLLHRSDVVLVRQKYQEKEECKSIPLFLGALSGTRTLGPLIKSQLLYQLS